MKMNFKIAAALIQSAATPEQWRRLLTFNRNCGWIYKMYLGSNAWRSKREERLAIDYHKCTACLISSDLDVHHKTYRNIGDENVEQDLITLCNECHKAEHYQDEP